MGIGGRIASKLKACAHHGKVARVIEPKIANSIKPGPVIGLAKILHLRKTSAKISSAVLVEVIDVLRENDIPFGVAPFEADWQLACIINAGIVHAIGTTDGDFWALLYLFP